jgi:ABC-2 type transport system permease protein
MLFIPLVRKEVYWSKHNALIVAFLLVFIPAALAFSTAAVQETVPEDVPVAVVAQNENVTDRELRQATAGLDVFAEAQTVESEGSPAANREQAIEMLEREEVYLVVEVPAGLLDEETDSIQLQFVFDGGTAPLHQADTEIEDIARVRFNSIRATATGSEEGNVEIESSIHGDEKGLGEFLFPAYMLGLVLVFAFTYVPYALRRDAGVLDRLRLDTSVGSFVASKLVFLTVAMLVPLLVFHGAGLALGYDVGTLSPVSLVVSLAVLLGVFLAAGLVAASVTALTRFTDASQSLNLLVLLGFLAASAIAFPRGAVAPGRAQIAQFLPTHYAAVTVRSLMLRDVSPAAYLGMIGTLVAMIVAGAILLAGSVAYYRRTT